MAIVVCQATLDDRKIVSDILLEAAKWLEQQGMYERLGFRHHSDRQVGPYFIARYYYLL